MGGGVSPWATGSLGKSFWSHGGSREPRGEFELWVGLRFSLAKSFSSGGGSGVASRRVLGLGGAAAQPRWEFLVSRRQRLSLGRSLKSGGGCGAASVGVWTLTEAAVQPTARVSSLGEAPGSRSGEFEVSKEQRRSFASEF